MNDKEHNPEFLYYYVVMANGDRFYCNRIANNDDGTFTLVGAYRLGDQNRSKVPPIEVTVVSGLSYYYEISHPILPEYWASVMKEAEQL